MDGSQRGTDLKYSAFISYNHRDRRSAMWMHRAIERYRIPKRLVGHASPFGALGRRLPPAFRDRDELASSSDLAASVRAALEQSAFLVVICTPNSAASRWVNEEIRTFIALGRRDRIRLVIFDGEPMSEDNAVNCIPPAMLEGAESEPLAADARKGQDGPTGAKLKVLAGMLGVSYDELRQREAVRRQQRLAVIAAASSLGFVVTTGLAVAAVIARQQAEEARKIAEQRTVTAERTLSFVKGMFRVSDPSIAQGEGDKITAREVVDRGARMLETGLEREPAVKADLGATLAEVYNALGLYQRGYDIVSRTMSLKHGQPDVTVRQLTTMSETQSLLGEYEQAERNLEKAEKLLQSPGVTPDMRSRVLVDLGQLQAQEGLYEQARATLGRALAIDRAIGEDGQSSVARDLEALGTNAFYAGKLDEARAHVKQALDMRMRVEGPNSPSVTDNRNTLASIAYTEGDLKGAELLYRENLKRDEKVLGPKHPDIAITLNNLARMLIDQRRFAEAAPMLQRAIEVTVKQRGEAHDDLVFFYSNLALVRRYTGKPDEADGLFRKAVSLGKLRQHPLLGQIIADWADLSCSTGNAARGLELAGQARERVAADLADQPWRMAWVDNVSGACMVSGGRADEGRRLMAASLPVISERWAAGTLFGTVARSRGGRL